MQFTLFLNSGNLLNHGRANPGQKKKFGKGKRLTDNQTARSWRRRNPIPFLFSYFLYLVSCYLAILLNPFFLFLFSYFF
jgi:hypothetical protein